MMDSTQHQPIIKIFRGDDTDWNGKNFLNFSITSSDTDLSSMTARFKIGECVFDNISLSTGQFTLNFTREQTAAMPWGLNKGILQIIDSNGKIKTIANHICFWVTNELFEEERQTIEITTSESESVDLILQVGSQYATCEALQAEVTNRQTADSSLQAQININKTKLSLFAPYIQQAAVRDFNEQTVVNAAELLAATGDLHALHLDLSSNHQLAKVTATGASGNLANLSGVLVSNQAPLDHNTSPQVDVSYAALDRTALVNLFNSMPYNIGYTLQGSPTITDGILSGMSATDYLKITPYIPSGDMEFQFAFNVGTLGTNCCAFEIPGIFSLFIHSNSIKIWNFKNSSFPEIISSSNVSANDDFVIRFVRTGTSYTYSWAKNGGTFSSPSVLDLNQTQTGWAAMGAPTTDTSRYFRGTIDLNNTFINIDGAPWFKSTPEMVKTCSVVGCTGTADLTQTDKDIILNKGWSLAVA